MKMEDKLIEHIRRKLYEKDEVLDCFDVPTDEQIRYFMLVTFEIVENHCIKCFFCKNYKRFSFGSLCRIKPHTQKYCFHFSLNIQKVLDNKYYKILITIDECTRGKHITTDKTLSSKTQRNMIYESVRLYEMIQCLKQVNRTDNDLPQLQWK
ncbi:MAG: hypothetical protein Q4Q14_05385 [Methanobrevibacter sp.]|nr:hypothetical protein [Methanobrevibacter sp.]